MFTLSLNKNYPTMTSIIIQTQRPDGTIVHRPAPYEATFYTVTIDGVVLYLSFSTNLKYTYEYLIKEYQGGKKRLRPLFSKGVTHYSTISRHVRENGYYRWYFQDPNGVDCTVLIQRIHANPKTHFGIDGK